LETKPEEKKEDKKEEKPATKEGEEKMPTTIDPAIKQMQDMIASLAESVKSVADANKQTIVQLDAERLETYRSSLISDIPADFQEFVTGKSKEEVDASVAAMRKKLSAILPKPSNENRYEVHLPGAPGEGTLADTEITSEDIRNMSADDFAKFLDSNDRFSTGSQTTGMDMMKRGLSGR
jgi:polyribonucleotide nucleotidyltransferase